MAKHIKTTFYNPFTFVVIQAPTETMWRYGYKEENWIFNLELSFFFVASFRFSYMFREWCEQRTRRRDQENLFRYFVFQSIIGELKLHNLRARKCFSVFRVSIRQSTFLFVTKNSFKYMFLVGALEKIATQSIVYLKNWQLKGALKRFWCLTAENWKLSSSSQCFQKWNFLEAIGESATKILHFFNQQSNLKKAISLVS